MIPPIIADASEAFARAFAIYGPDEVPDSSFVAFGVTLEMANEHEDDPDVLDRVSEIAKYEGMMATLELRRKKLSKRWATKVKPISKSIAVVFPTSEYITNAHRHVDAANLGSHLNSSRPVRVQRTAIAKGVAFAALRSALRDHPDIAKEWTELVALAEAEGQAEGVVQATALMHEAGTLPAPAGTELDLDQLYKDTLANLRELDSFGSQTPRWISDQIGGLAGDMGKAIADGIVRDFGTDDLQQYINEIIDKGDGVQAYIDEAIHFSMQQASVAQMSALGVEMFDYVAMPDACPICAPLDSSIVGAYTLENLPAIPQHIGCRCLSTEAGTVSL